MASSALRKRTTVVRRSGPSPKLLKLQARLKNLGSRAGAKAAGVELRAITIGAPVAFAMAERKGVKLPSVMGLDPALLIGGALAVFGGKAGGRNGKRLEAAGDGILAYAAARSAARGSVKVAGTEIIGGVDDDDEDV